MKIVLDTNILFSALLKRKHFYKTLFSSFDIFLPAFALAELAIYKEVFTKKTDISTNDFQSFAQEIFSHITIIPDIFLFDSAHKESISLCEGVDIKDAPYVALAIHMNCLFVTRDKPLYHHFIDKDFKDVILFNDFIDKYLSE